MDTEAARALLLQLPHVVETMQWGDNLVFWVGDKAIGGKMFALMDLGGRGGPVIAFAAGPERAAELCEQPGFRPAPYLARAHWVAAEGWDVLRPRAWHEAFANAHATVFGRLPARVKAALALPARQQKALILERRAAAATARPKSAGAGPA